MENLALVVGLAPVGICFGYLLYGSNCPGFGSFVTKFGNESNHFFPFQQISSNNLYVKSFRFLPSFI